MQHAIPTTLGIKFAGWLDALVRHRERFTETQNRCLALQFGGAAGTLAALGSQGEVIAKKLIEELKLPLPRMPWHSHRDRLSEIATTFGLLTGTLGKIARDISLHMQTEIDELREPAEEGRGVSSTMPHKRNPIACAMILQPQHASQELVSHHVDRHAAGGRARPGRLARRMGDLPEIVCLTAGAMHHLTDVVPRLEIDVKRMRENLELTEGLIFAESITAALGKKIPRSQARELIDAASQRGRSRKTVSLEKSSMTTENRQASFIHKSSISLFDPRNYTGSTSKFIDRVLEDHKSQKNT